MEMRLDGHFRERPKKHHWELEIKSAGFVMDIILSTCSQNELKGHQNLTSIR